jgi:DNA-binding NtrC family response regulator
MRSFSNVRLSPRIVVQIPAEIEYGTVRQDALIVSLGLEGAFVKGPVDPAQKLSCVRYELPSGRIEHRARLVRTTPFGSGLAFVDCEGAMKTRLWRYIADRLVAGSACPFCGEPVATLRCTSCGWDLAFDREGYFEYWEKTAAFKHLESRIVGLPLAELRKLLDFVDVDLLKSRTSEEMEEFVGTGNAMLEVFSKIRKVAKTDLSVLILGESGTGKELTACAIHERSPRKTKPFVTINCAAIPENLLEAELFGYEKGSFTGAYASKKGKIESADGGTLFLDEIGEMPLSLQAKLLRFLQDRLVERIGSTSGRRVNIRVIAATNCDLKCAQDEGRFRSDLYFRLDEFSINLPPVRDRGEDVVVLARFFLAKFSREMGLTKAFTKKSLDAIEAYGWPGNVREMINKIRRAIVMSDGPTINPTDLALDGPGMGRTSSVLPLKEEVNQVEAQKVREILSLCGNNISKAAKLLKLSRPSLYSRIKKYHLDAGSVMGRKAHH